MASFANNGRTIIIEPVPQPTTPSRTTTPAQPAQAAGVASPASVTSALPAIRHYFVVIDPSHGGDERGASLTNQLAEKDITLAFARRLRQELEARGLATLLLRDGDTTLSLDQRASLTNSAHPAIYLCLHAASQGNGVRVYTALVPGGSENRGPFLSWDGAQSAFQLLSRSAGSGLVTALQNKQVPTRSLITPLRPLNNITTAALALEVAPPSDDVSQLNSPAYQQIVASAIASGIADVRDKLEAGR
jgi:N-acetylmuramoyl-L-alanine amidase